MRCRQKACWQGCSRGFVQHAVRLRNGLRMQAQMRPASHATRPARFLVETLRERLPRVRTRRFNV